MTEPIPSAGIPAVDQMGFFRPPWARFFASLVAKSSAFVGITGGAFTATGSGSVALSGGSISAVTITRGGTAMTISGPVSFVPVSPGDLVTWTATGTVTATFIPA